MREGMLSMSNMTLGSLFDGSGGFPLAGAMCGVSPVWASEIEPYPIAVTRSRFPRMAHLGSVTEINGGAIAPVDIITFGSPCQDMSVAGKRAGMKHAEHGADNTTRSGLFYEAVRIIREMRESTNGRHPTYAIWENVPGAFTSNKGEDFRCVLEELQKACGGGSTIPRPTDGKWPRCGEVLGDGWSIAWRILDAQFWGVPQRRRRIYLVVDFAGGRAGKILFERAGLRGDITPSGTAREGASLNPQGSAGGSGGVKCLNPWDSQSKRQYQIDGIYPCLDAGASQSGQAHGIVYALQGNGIDRADTAGCNGRGWHEGICYTLNTIDRPAVAFMAGQGAKARSIGTMEDCSPTLKGCPSGLNQAPSVVYSIDPLSSNSMKSANPNSGFHEAEVAKCIDTSDQNPSKNQGGNVIVQGNNEAVFPRVARTLTAEADASPCIDRGQNIVVVDRRDPIIYDGRGNGNGCLASTITGDHDARVGDYTNLVCCQNTGRGWWNEGEVAETLRTPCGGDSTKANLVVFAQNQRDEVRDLDGKTGAISAHPGVKQQTYVAIDNDPSVFPMQAFGLYGEAGSPASSVKARDYKDATDLVVNSGKPPRRYIVRRLTPIECQRLQGFPDGWGAPDDKTDMSDDEAAFWEDVRKTHAEATGKRYTPMTNRDRLVGLYRKLHTDSAEYKMWGNGIALPCALYVMQGVAEAIGTADAKEAE